MDNHMTRQQLLTAGTVAEDQWPDHLRTCQVCQQALIMLQQFPLVGRLHLPEPPEAWVKKAKALAAPGAVTTLVTKLVGRLAFDSWLLPSPAGVRGGAATSDRRLRYEVDPVILDIRIERRGKIWSSVAQISGTGGKSVNLLINGRVIPLGTGGMAQQSGSQPPRHISLQVDDQTVELPEVSWRNRRTS